jgi:hypothetical protein
VASQRKPLTLQSRWLYFYSLVSARKWEIMKTQCTFAVAMLLLFSIGPGGVWVFSQKSGREKRDGKVAKEQFRRAEKVLAAQEAKLLSLPGVVGVGIGMTKKGDQPAIHVYLNVKAAGGERPAAIPKQIDKVPVRIMETDEIKAR